MPHFRNTAAKSFSRPALCALLMSTMLVALGCGETNFEEATGRSQFRGINGIVDADEAVFLIEENPLGQLPFKSATGQQEFDNLSYNFNFDVPILGADDRRLATQFVDAVEDIEYTFILAGTTAAPEIVLLERPEPAWEGGEPEFDLRVSHVNRSAGDVDVYLAIPGTAPVAGNAIGSLNFGGQIADMRFAAGEYQVTLTPAGDPGTVLFVSPTFNVAGADTYDVIVFDGDPSITGPLAVRLINSAGAAVELSDERFPPTVQFIHAAFGTGNVDVVADANFAAPLVSDLGFGQRSADVDTVMANTAYAFAPTGNTMPLAETEFALVAGSRAMALLIGAAGSLQTIVLNSERRSVSTAALYRVTNASANGEGLDIYLTAPGADIANETETISNLPLATATPIARQLPGTYDLTITRDQSTTPLVGPLPLVIANGDLVEIIVLDSADPNVADTLIFSGVNP